MARCGVCRNLLLGSANWQPAVNRNTSPDPCKWSAVTSLPTAKDLPEEAAALMQPAKDVLQERPLGKAINNVKNNAPELLA